MSLLFFALLFLFSFLLSCFLLTALIFAFLGSAFAITLCDSCSFFFAAAACSAFLSAVRTESLASFTASVSTMLLIQFIFVTALSTGPWYGSDGSAITWSLYL